jgi:hypothetical protein
LRAHRQKTGCINSHLFQAEFILSQRYFKPLFTAFGVEAIDYRLEKAATKVVFTDSHNREKFNDINPLLLTSTKNNRLTEKQCKYKIIPFWSQAVRQV